MRKRRKPIQKIQQVNTDGKEILKNDKLLTNDTACRQRDKFSRRSVFEYHVDHSKLDREFGININEYKISQKSNKLTRESFLINKGD